MRTIISASDLKYTEDGSVQMNAEFAELKAAGKMSFVATPNDIEAHGCDIYKRAIAGEWGPIKPFEPDVMGERIIAIAGLNNTIKMLSAGYVAQVPPLKIEEAERIEHDPNPTADDYPILDADVGYEAPTLKEVGARVRRENRETHQRAAKLERCRLKTIDKLKKANNVGEIRAIVDLLNDELQLFAKDPQIIWDDPNEWQWPIPTTK